MIRSESNDQCSASHTNDACEVVAEEQRSRQSKKVQWPDESGRWTWFENAELGWEPTRKSNKDADRWRLVQKVLVQSVIEMRRNAFALDPIFDRRCCRRLRWLWSRNRVRPESLRIKQTRKLYGQRVENKPLIEQRMWMVDKESEKEERQRRTNIINVRLTLHAKREKRS